MTRFRKLLAVAGLAAGMVFSISSTARANDWDRNDWRDRYQQREPHRDYWRDRDGRCFRRAWDPYRGWIVVQVYPQPPYYMRHDHGRHQGWYKHEHREWRDRDDD